VDALFCELPHVRFELVVLVLHRVEEQALGEIGPPLLVVHLLDEVLNLLDHVLERSLELAFGGHFLVERLHDGEQIAVECNGCASGRLDGVHGYAPKLLTALGSSAWISMKFCAPVIVSIVSTRFWTPDSFSRPPAPCTCRYRSIRQPIVALLT